jgi:hypothetical protein
LDEDDEEQRASLDEDDEEYVSSDLDEEEVVASAVQSRDFPPKEMLKKVLLDAMSTLAKLLLAD